MSALANAHAGTVAGSAYGNIVCCSGEAGLSNACSGSYDTVLWLSAADNAHVASDGSYGTQVCLAADAGMNCQYGASCPAGYACLATISGTNNAHVADCDGSGDYGTKVCCGAAAACPEAIGNGTGIPGDDATDPAMAADCDNDGLSDGDELSGAACGGIATDPGPDITYDDDSNGIMLDGSDDGAAWDSDGDGARDGAECALGTDPTNPGSMPSSAQCGGTGDTDGDGLLDAWETCKWGTNPAVIDSDSDGTGDCKEAADVDGNGIVDFVDDVIYYAKAALLPAATFGKDGDFDIDGNGIVDFVDDVVQEAKFALIAGLCK
jgi:hypothetical protein